MTAVLDLLGTIASIFFCISFKTFETPILTEQITSPLSYRDPMGR